MACRSAVCDGTPGAGRGGRSLRRSAALLAFVFVVWPDVIGSAPQVDIQLVSRRLAPGELILFTMSFDGDLSSVGVSVFGKRFPAFKIEDRRWRALIGVDLATPPRRYTAIVEADTGSEVLRQSRSFDVARRTFPTRTLRVDPEFVNPPDDDLQRIAREADFLRNTFGSSAEARLWSAPFVRPVPGEANSRFGSRSVFNGEPRSPHGGADFLSPSGTPIQAPNAGRVVCARDLFFTGNTVVVDHGLGVFSLLAHLSRIEVAEGDVVTAGQVVGLVGATGRVTGPHLHWALNVSGARVDPLSVLALLGK